MGDGTEVRKGALLSALDRFFRVKGRGAGVAVLSDLQRVGPGEGHPQVRPIKEVFPSTRSFTNPVPTSAAGFRMAEM